MSALPLLVRGTRKLLGIQLSEEQVEAFQWYARELVIWNERFNLTAITDLEEIEVKHFLDSLTPLLAMGPSPQGRVTDVGTGAGFPGLPIKILYPRLAVTLVESNNKKVEFCRHVAEGLGLRGVEVVHARAEELGQHAEHREGSRWVLARAVAKLDILAEYMLPLLEIGGVGIAQKGDTGPLEAQSAEAAIEMLGGRLEGLLPIELPGVAEVRYLVQLEKVARTPEKYPRRPGMPEKRPLAG